MNDVSVICVSRCGITCGTFYGKHVLTLIWVIKTGGSFKIVSNWAVLTAITTTSLVMANISAESSKVQEIVPVAEHTSIGSTEPKRRGGKATDRLE